MTASSLAAFFLLFSLGVAAEPVRVRTTALAGLLEVPTYSAPATVVARNAPQLAAEIDARILELVVDVGDRVAADQLLARLDCRRYRSVHDAAKAAVERWRAHHSFSERQLTRARDLKKNRSISEELLDQRRNELSTADAELQGAREALRQAEIDVGHCEVRAPFDAVITRRPASVGDYATRGTVLFGLLDTAGQEVSVALRQDRVGSLQASASISFDSNGQRHPVQLRALLPQADPVARTREARLVFTGQPAIAGSAGRIVWHGRRNLLPPEYLVRRGDALGIFTVNDGHAHFTVLPGAQDGRPVAVDLPPATPLVTDGRQILTDGDAVSVSASDKR